MVQLEALQSGCRLFVGHGQSLGCC